MFQLIGKLNTVSVQDYKFTTQMNTVTYTNTIWGAEVGRLLTH